MVCLCVSLSLAKECSIGLESRIFGNMASSPQAHSRQHRIQTAAQNSHQERAGQRGFRRATVPNCTVSKSRPECRRASLECPLPENTQKSGYPPTPSSIPVQPQMISTMPVATKPAPNQRMWCAEHGFHFLQPALSQTSFDTRLLCPHHRGSPEAQKPLVSLEAYV